MGKHSLKFILFSLFIISTAAYAKPWKFELRAKDKFERAELANLGYALEDIQTDRLTIYGSEKDLETLKKSGRLISAKEISQTEILDFPGYDEQFHNYDELTRELQQLAKNNQDIMSLGSAGMTLERRIIHHVILSENPQQSSNKPAVAMMGGHHAREHISVELPLGIINDFIQKYRSGDETVTRLLRTRAFHIIPIVNPDGSEHDIEDGDYKWWRKNRKVMDEAVGVDLNRNYDYAWGTTGTSDRQNSDVYHGPAPFSELETQAIKNLVENNENISILVSFHTYSELILYPWGHTYDRIPSERDFLVHKTMAETMAEWNGYEPKQSSSLYPASGDTTDWAYGVHGIFSFTFELDPKSRFDGGFYPGQSAIRPVFEKNLPAILYLGDLADNPYRALESKSNQYGLKSPLLDL